MTRRGGRQPEVALPNGLRLRAWEQSDASALLTAMRDPLIRRYSGFLVEDRATALRTIQLYAATWSDGEGPAWALADPGGCLVGAVRFRLVEPSLRAGMVGYWLCAPVRGAGVASAAVREGSRLVFERLGWHRVELLHAVENERSCAVARRCGYRYEGTARDAMHYPDGDRWSDEHVHARLADDRSGWGGEAS